VISLVVVGAAGRMGRAVAEAAARDSAFLLKACVERSANLPQAGGVWSDDLGAVLAPGDVVVEFTAPDVCGAVAGQCALHGAALVSGTTGITAGDDGALREASKRVAVLRAANFSLGVVALRRALEAALDALPAGWDVEIVERHHRMKADSPSGTALALAAVARGKRGLPQEALRFGREGRLGPRPAEEIGVHAVRGGTLVGDHTVVLAGEGEWLELRHVAQDRMAFAHGALAAARFVASTGAGIYKLEDVLGAGMR